MRNFAWMAVVAFALTITGCKYEEGPFMSFVSKENRVAQIWEVEYATDAKGEDVTSTFSSWILDFQEDGTASISLEIIGFPVDLTGTWALEDSKEEFRIQTDEINGVTLFGGRYDILRLTRTEFWLIDDNNPEAVIHLKIK
ncbi:hypothetical protein [Pontibacter sp. G13]|uniref:hypothetical protein n=1 Tax=Pontibacter sp. G13 TaxID=3074898 RepID=UPI0028896710|nr:hypothetical protein [Pontibacter sp. G13]WNJ21355.1 hypothetical protein RJD25_12880 [Pontibacter sp. G13]